MKDLIEKLIAQMVDEGLFFQDAVSEFEKHFIRKVLEVNHGNQSETAKALGIHRNTLGRKMEEYKFPNPNGSRKRANGRPSRPKKKK